MPNPPRRSPKQHRHVHYMMEAMRRLEWDMHTCIDRTGHIPFEWHEIAQRPGRAKGVRVTMVLDGDVLRFFRSMGVGYGPRINDVLTSYMQARLAGIVRGPETINAYKVREDHHDGPKPQWGDVAREDGEVWEDAPDPDPRKSELERMKEKYREMRAKMGLE